MTSRERAERAVWDWERNATDWTLHRGYARESLVKIIDGEIVKLEDKLITAQSNNAGLSKENRRLRAANESLDEELRGQSASDPSYTEACTRIWYLENDKKAITEENEDLRQQIHDAKHMRTSALDNSLVELNLMGRVKGLEDALNREGVAHELTKRWLHRAEMAIYQCTGTFPILSDDPSPDESDQLRNLKKESKGLRKKLEKAKKVLG